MGYHVTALAQSAERTAFNRVVAGSIPACGAQDALAHTSVATFCPRCLYHVIMILFLHK